MKNNKLDVFSAWMPIDMEKAEVGEYNGEPRFNPQRIKIMGIASTEAPDEAGEIIIQDGIDWSYFLKRGFLNLEHKQGPEFVLGQPEAVKACEYKGYKATMLKGYLYGEKANVKSLVETMEAMKKAGADRSIGLSVEGQVVERDERNPTIITKSKVLNVSVTSSPCNKDATMSIVKSILAKKDSEFYDKEMTRRQIEVLCGYCEETKELLDRLPEDVDLQEWVQSKVTRALDYVQAAYHYMDVEFKMYEDEETEKAWYNKEKENIYKEEIEDLVEEVLEKYPQLKDRKVMEQLHEYIEVDKAVSDDMTPDEALDAMDKDPVAFVGDMPDFAAIQDAIVDAGIDNQDDEILEESVGYQTPASPHEGPMSPIVPQSFENPISTRDYSKSDDDMRRLLNIIMRKYPEQTTKFYYKMYMQMPAELRFLLLQDKLKQK